jgi:hypothetical protein
MTGLAAVRAAIDPPRPESMLLFAFVVTHRRDREGVVGQLQLVSKITI